MLHQIIYTSRATQRLSSLALVGLFKQAQAANNEVGLTGLLVYQDGRFLQVLEGESAAVTATYARILQDPRHDQLRQLADELIARRSFAAWSMAFREVETSQFNSLVGCLSVPTASQLMVPTSRDHAILTQLHAILPSAAFHT